MKRRRKPVHRLPKIPDGPSTGTWEWEQVHSPYTFEGRMDLVGKFARGAAARARRRRLRRADRPRRSVLGAVVTVTAVALGMLVAIVVILAF